MRRKPIRTLSGVAPVTVLTKPYPCPGKCIFCPSDVRMPKSYLSDEPGAQRAAQHRFDPYDQTTSRLQTLLNTGHSIDKVELIVLGGTWSSYPESYQLWFILRCFDALNEADRLTAGGVARETSDHFNRFDYRTLEDRVDGRRLAESYNEAVRRLAPEPRHEEATWEQVEAAHARNESASSRCVGLVVETRPDSLDLAEALRLRRLGATKIQIGIQSASDRVLELNHRGHDVATTRRAFRALRRVGFKIHAHWMPNLYGSSPELDIEDYGRLFDDPDLRPDELKIYPCSLIESAELMSYHEDGRWRPYGHEELLTVLRACFLATPEYCRLTRVIRDIPGTDIVTGNKLTNFRQIVEASLDADGLRSREIRSREVRGRKIHHDELTLERCEYRGGAGHEVFLQYVTPDDRLAAFLRLGLPELGEESEQEAPHDELEDAALLREVHVYGRLVELHRQEPGRPQHVGLGRSLVEAAAGIARRRGYRHLAVISAVGTRRYYRSLGFDDGVLYQLLELS